MITKEALEQKLLNNVVDLRFMRRIPVPGRPATRRMLCTKSSSLLNSTNGRMSLNYKPPLGGKQFNETKQNALIVWDIFMQSFRVVSLEGAIVLNEIPANDEFWKYYNQVLLAMTAEQKLQFMNS
jgi:hypothetical protein